MDADVIIFERETKLGAEYEWKPARWAIGGGWYPVAVSNDWNVFLIHAQYATNLQLLEMLAALRGVDYPASWVDAANGGRDHLFVWYPDGEDTRINPREYDAVVKEAEESARAFWEGIKE